MQNNAYICSMMNEATREYISQHLTDDVRQLALRQAPRGSQGQAVDMVMALQQISGWQTARQKLPTWAATPGIVYPPHLNMEQCSSELTARYKAALVASHSALHTPHSTLHNPQSTFIDLTGGFGVDFYWMSQGFERRIYVEQQESLCDVARHNFAQLGHECSVVCGSAADVLAQTDHADVVFLDPARRDRQGARTYAISDCTPDVLELLPLLRQKADRIVLKLSPMLDWHKAVADLGGAAEVHIVSVQNECKELVVDIELRGARYGVRGHQSPSEAHSQCVHGNLAPRTSHLVPRNNHLVARNLHCVNLMNDGTQQLFSAPLDAPTASQHFSHLVPRTSHLENNTSPLGPFLFEPNASIMKGGCFAAVAQRYGVQKVADNSHLFVAAHDVPDFPGRRFTIERTTTMNRRELKAALNGLTQANIAVRNFPLSTAELRKRLRLKDGGDAYIFATTTADGQHLLLVCRRALGDLF